jgi:GNAT superfamily N-acetyltransferase
VGDQIIGYCYGKLKPYKTKQYAIFRGKGKYFCLEEIYVKKRYRNGSIGSGLIKILKRELSKLGVKSWLIYSAVMNSQKIQNFYKKIGAKSWYVMMYMA